MGILETAADPGARDGTVAHHGAGVRGADGHRRAGALLVGGAVREADADLSIAVHREAGAVEAAAGAGAAVNVGDAQIALRDRHDGGVARPAGVDDGAASASAAGVGCGGLRRGLSGCCGLLLLALDVRPVSYTHLRAHETDSYLVCRLLLEKK